MKIAGETFVFKPYDSVYDQTHNMYFVVKRGSYPDYSIAMHARASSSKDGDESFCGEQSSWLIRGIKPCLYLVHDGGEVVNSYGMQPDEYHVHGRGRFDHYSTGSGYIKYDFEKEEVVSRAEIYWADNTDEPHAPFKGNDTLPEQCVLEVIVKGKIVLRKGLDKIEKDKYNVIEFPKTKADGMRLVLKAKAGFNVGILEWKVL